MIDADPVSIDFFLERRVEFAELGKAAIAQQILQCELQAKVGSYHAASVLENWYQHLFSCLYECDFSDLMDSGLKIVTFNYDRSLDHYLFKSIRAIYNVDEVTAANVLKIIGPFHLHGQVGWLPWQNQSGWDYGRTKDRLPLHKSNCVWEASRLINIVHEANGASEEYKKTIKRLKSAERVIFLGFGYHQQPLEILGFPLKEWAHMQGSCNGFTEQEIFSLNKRFGLNLEIHTRSMNVLEFLRERVDLQSV